MSTKLTIEEAKKILEKNLQDSMKRKLYREQYDKRPDRVAKRKEYNAQRYQEKKRLLEEAKKLLG